MTVPGGLDTDGQAERVQLGTTPKAELDASEKPLPPLYHCAVEPEAKRAME